MLTCPAKLLKASAEILTVFDDPAARDRVGCGTAKAKSAPPVGVMALCVIDPEVAVTVMLS
jgi:hypothetical protein